MRVMGKDQIGRFRGCMAGKTSRLHYRIWTAVRELFPAPTARRRILIRVFDHDLNIERLACNGSPAQELRNSILVQSKGSRLHSKGVSGLLILHLVPCKPNDNRAVSVWEPILLKIFDRDLVAKFRADVVRWRPYGGHRDQRPSPVTLGKRGIVGRGAPSAASTRGEPGNLQAQNSNKMAIERDP